jgi:ADP-ribosylglycohydrolase
MIKGFIGDYIGSIHEGYQWTKKDQDILNLNAERIPVIKDAFNKRIEQSITDDSICTLGLYKAYSEGAIGDESAQILANFCKEHRDCGFGKQFEKWIDNPIPYNSFANGCLMRLGFLEYVPENERLYFGIDYTVISHNHDDSVDSVKDYIEILNNKGNTFVLNNIIKKREIKKTVEDYHNDKKFEISAKGTLDQALIVLKESNSFIEILQNCMFIGGDTDTLATIACNLSKFEIPEELLFILKEKMKNLI